MILTIIVTAILVVSIILWVIGYNSVITTMEATGMSFTLLSGITVISIICIIVLKHCAISQLIIQNQNSKRGRGS